MILNIFDFINFHFEIANGQLTIQHFKATFYLTLGFSVAVSAVLSFFTYAEVEDKVVELNELSIKNKFHEIYPMIITNVIGLNSIGFIILMLIGIFLLNISGAVFVIGGIVSIVAYFMISFRIIRRILFNIILHSTIELHNILKVQKYNSIRNSTKI